MDKLYPLDVKNKIVVVTGGYGYLGKAIVKSFAAHGAKVFVIAKSSDKFSEAFKNDKAVSFIEGDVSSSDSIEEAFNKVASQEKRIDVLVNNAFYSKGQSPELMSDDDWDLGIDGTLGNVFRCIRAIIPFYKKQSGGKIINVSSMYGMVAPDFSVYDQSPEFLNPPHYGAAKAGVLQLTRYYASYLGKLGVTVNAVTPGPFPSDTVQTNKNFIEQLSAKTALGRVGKPEDLAGAFVFLASDAANYITGQNIVVDGGWTAK